MRFSDSLRTVLIIPFKYDSLSIWVIFVCQKSICESTQHPVHAFINYKYLPTAYMIISSLQLFAKASLKEYLEITILVTTWLWGSHLSCRVMMLVQNCLKLYRLYDVVAWSQWWRKKHFLSRFHFKLFVLLWICTNLQNDSVLQVPELVQPPKHQSMCFHQGQK